MKKLFLLLNLLPVCVQAQSYLINWHKIAGGGGTSTNGPYSLSGTIGQPDATTVMTSGSYSLTGGFWALFAVQTPGAPLLTIFGTATNSVIVAWPAASTGFSLQQTSSLSTTNWVNVTNVVGVVGGANQVVFTTPSGNQFFRLISR